MSILNRVGAGRAGGRAPRRSPASRGWASAERAALDELVERLADTYPYGSARYAGQMLKPPHAVARAAYATAMALNPNNHALDGGPATAAMEREAVADLAAMFGLGEHLGHLSASGTIANLEALWVARELRPDGGHPLGRERALHARAHVRGPRRAPRDAAAGPRRAAGPRGARGAARRRAAWAPSWRRSARPGSAWSTRSTAIADLCAAYGARLHVDAAYGGFFTLLADGGEPGVAPRAVRRRAARRLHRRRPAQARPPAVRLRRGAVPRPRRRPAVQPRLAVHVLHVRASCTSARSAWSARAPAPRPRRCGRRCGSSPSTATGSGRSSARPARRRWRSPRRPATTCRSWCRRTSTSSARSRAGPGRAR